MTETPPAAGPESAAAAPLPAGFDGPRACGPFDLAPTLDLINLVFRTRPANGQPGDPSMGWDYSHVYHPDNLPNVRIVCHRGRPVASVGISCTTVRTLRGAVEVGGINAVATHPDYRRLGLGTATLVDSWRQMQAQGVQLGLLSTGISNYYRKLGWERAGRQRQFTFDRANLTALPAAPDLDVSEDWAPCAPQMAALYDAVTKGAAGGSVRSPERFALLVGRKAGRVFVARRGGTVVAYAALSGSAVREHAGAPSDVAALIRRLFPEVERLPAHTTERAGSQQGQYELSVITPDTPDGLPAFLQDLGIPSALHYLGMLAVLDAPALLRALDLPFEVERRGERWHLRHGRHALDLSAGELTKLLFGPERRPDFAPDLLPVPFFQWPLDRV